MTQVGFDSSSAQDSSKWFDPELKKWSEETDITGRRLFVSTLTTLSLSQQLAMTFNSAVAWFWLWVATLIFLPLGPRSPRQSQLLLNQVERQR